ncbi:MAG: hypothetical protein WDW36_009903 [Sanguina aurantia]
MKGKGHSAAVWLSAKPDLHLVSFDLGSYPYTLQAVTFFGRSHPGRISWVMGDSTKTVPMLRELYGGKCDILVVDGGHEPGTAQADLLNLRLYARPNFNVMVMDDVNCSPMEFCRGPEAALHLLMRRGAAEVFANFSMSFNEGQHMRGFSVGRFTAGLPAITLPRSTTAGEQSEGA